MYVMNSQPGLVKQLYPRVHKNTGRWRIGKDHNDDCVSIYYIQLSKENKQKR